MKIENRSIRGEAAVALTSSKTSQDVIQKESAEESQEDISKTNESKDVLPTVFQEPPLPASSPLFRRRIRKHSTCEIQPCACASTEVMEIQEIRIEQGVVMAVKESTTTLPELTRTNKAFRDIHDKQQMTDTMCLPLYGSPQHREIRKTRSNPSESLLDAKDTSSTLTLHRLPRGRRRSLVTMPSYPVAAPSCPVTIRHRDRNVPSPPPARRFSGVVQARDCWQANNSTTNALEEHQKRMSKPWNENITIREPRNDKQEKCAANADKKSSDDEQSTHPEEEFEEKFRPRLRSRSLHDIRLAVRQRVLESREVKKGKRRKSFEMWLTDKEKDMMQKMNELALGKRREADEEERRNRKGKKGKSFEKWLCDKTGEEGTRKQMEVATEVATRNETKHDTNARQRVSRARYEKWLSEKETQAFEKEKEMLKKAERKTIEMRKKYEEKEKIRMNEGLRYSIGPVCE